MSTEIPEPPYRDLPHNQPAWQRLIAAWKKADEWEKRASERHDRAYRKQQFRDYELQLVSDRKKHILRAIACLAYKQGIEVPESTTGHFVAVAVGGQVVTLTGRDASSDGGSDYPPIEAEVWPEAGG